MNIISLSLRIRINKNVNRRAEIEIGRKYQLMRRELDNKNQAIVNLTQEKISLESKLNRVKQSKYKEELEEA